MPTATKSKLIGRPTSQLVPLTDIDRDGRNHRLPSPDDKAKIAELAASLKRDGQLQAIRCYVTGDGEKLLLGYGHRRCAAAELAGMTTIRAEVRQAPRLADGEIDYGKIAAHRAIENLCRENLNPVEEAVGVAQILKSVDGDVSRAAAMIGKPERWVRDRGYIARLCKEVQERIIAGKLLLGYAREIAKLWTDKEQQITLAEWCEVRADGSCAWQLDTIRAEVKKRLRSLKVVAWDLDKPFAKAVACNACDLNTANDRNLFEHDAKPDDQAYCLDGQCFARKSEAAQKMLEKAAQSVVNREIPATTKAVADVTPEGVRPERVAREAKRLRGEEVEAEKKPEVAGPSDAELSQQRFEDAIEEWEAEARKAILAATKRNVEYLSCLLLLNETNYGMAGSGDAKESRLIEAVAHARTEDIAAEVFNLGDYQPLILSEMPVEHLQVIAGVWDLGLPPVPTPPDFQSPTEPAEPDADAQNAAALTQRDKFREQHPGHLLLFRIGDWLRAFNDDAKILHKVCGMGLATKRVKKVTTLSASIPAADAESKFKQLIAAGHKVAVCERAADPKAVAALDVATAATDLSREAKAAAAT